jgi:hypothetical protein
MKRIGIILILAFITAALTSCATPKKRKAQVVERELNEVDEYDSDNLYDYDSDMGTAVMGYYNSQEAPKKKKKKRRKRRRD